MKLTKLPEGHRFGLTERKRGTYPIAKLDGVWEICEETPDDPDARLAKHSSSGDLYQVKQLQEELDRGAR